MANPLAEQKLSCVCLYQAVTHTYPKGRVNMRRRVCRYNDRRRREIISDPFVDSHIGVAYVFLLRSVVEIVRIVVVILALRSLLRVDESVKVEGRRREK